MSRHLKKRTNTGTCINKHTTKACSTISQLVNLKRDNHIFVPIQLQRSRTNYKVTEILKDNKETVGAENSS